MNVIHVVPWHSTVDSQLHGVKETYEKVDEQDDVPGDVIIHEADEAEKRQ